LNSEKIGKYGTKVTWIVKRYDKCERNPTWKWKDMENMEKGKLNSEMIKKIWKKS
jgi:hypothetical protein